jgi:hypothetical protein
MKAKQPAEACVRGVMVERHPKAAREADGNFGSQVDRSS